MIVALVVSVVVLLLIRRRRARKTTLSGLNATAPTFTLAPPRRWSTTGRDHRL